MIHPLRVGDDDTEPGHGSTVASVGGWRRQEIELRGALTMLTRLPLPAAPAVGTGAGWFPLVGGLVGLAGLVPLVVLGSVVPTAAAVVAVAAITILSGGLHLDGLADTADALVAVGPDAAERARNDPAVGAAGATTLILVLGLDVAVVADLAANHGGVIAGLACVVAGASSRLVPPVLARLGRSGVVGRGLGDWFVSGTMTRDVALASALSLAVVLASAYATNGTALIVAGVVGGLGGVGVGLGLVRVRRQLDGDLFGASVEISFALTVLVAAVTAGWLGA